MRRGRRSRIMGVLAVLLGAMAFYPAVGQAQLELYDNFSGTQINPDKWNGAESFTSSSGNPNAEAQRYITGQKLRVALTTFGDVTSNTGDRSGRFGLSFPNPTPITAMQASVTVRQAMAQDCPANTAVSRARAQLIGAFFNDGTSPGAGNRIGDILAGIQKEQSHDGFLIRAFINRCTDSGCGSSSSAVPSQTFPTPWQIGRADTLLVQWDPANNRFLYEVNPGTSREESLTLTYPLSDGLPPVTNFKNIRASNNGANCMPPGVRTKVVMDARFDNVKLNPEAVPD